MGSIQTEQARQRHGRIKIIENQQTALMKRQNFLACGAQKLAFGSLTGGTFLRLRRAKSTHLLDVGVVLRDDENMAWLMEQDDVQDLWDMVRLMHTRVALNPPRANLPDYGSVRAARHLLFPQEDCGLYGGQLRD